MTRSRTAIAALCAVISLPAATAHAQADAGGAAFGTPSLGAEPAALHGQMTTIRGQRRDAAGKTVTVQRLLPDARWETLGQAVADATGAFSLPWRARTAGRYALRTLVDGEPATAQAQTASAATDTPQLTVYRAVKATWYGPGFFGNKTACGQRLRRGTRGVAHRTLPCGSVVELTFGGRTVRATVIDRGPFRAGVHYDLTQATKDDLGFDGLDTVGVLTISRPAPSSDAPAAS